jgi:UrcA family protein
MKTVLAALAAAAVGMTGFAAHADEFSLDLKKVNPATEQGQKQIRLWKNQVADAYCGPVDMYQPLDLEGVRLRCQMAVKADAQARIDAAEARIAADGARAAVTPRPAA